MGAGKLTMANIVEQQLHAVGDHDAPPRPTTWKTAPASLQRS
jgi:hypothetical protein